MFSDENTASERKFKANRSLVGPQGLGVSLAADGREWRRIPKKLVVGSVRDFPNEKAARKQLESLGLHINLDPSEGACQPRSLAELIAHYKLKELTIENERKAYSTKRCYEDYLTNWIVPRWGEYSRTRIENGIAVHVEEWLDSIERSRGTKAKIRNIMSAVCTHAIRYGWMKTNPIRAVRQSAKRERVPIPLTAEERNCSVQN